MMKKENLYAPQGGPIILSQAQDRMYEMLDSTILRRSDQDFQHDFLGSLVMKHNKDREEDENKFTDKQLKDNILTMLVADHDTTIVALTWLIKLLAQNLIFLESLRVLKTPYNLLRSDCYI